MKFTLTVPSSQDEITLEQNQKFVSLTKGKDRVKDAKIINDCAIHCFCSLPLEAIRHLKVKDRSFAIGQLNKVLNESHNNKRIVSVGGVEYGFIPNLDKMSYGEYEDLQDYLSDIADWNKAMAVFYRKVTVKRGELYQIEDYEGSAKYSEQMKKIPMSVVTGVDVFFYNLKNDLLETFQYYLKKNLLRKENKELFKSQEIDMKTFIQSLKESTGGLMGLQKWKLELPLNS